MKQLITALFLALGIARFVSADPASDFMLGNKAYQNKDYPKAIMAYENALKSGMTCAELEYNLGNALYKNGENAQAILHYERAKRLAPADEEIDFNLRVAGLKCVDKIDVMPQIFYQRWFSSTVGAMNEKNWSILFLIAFGSVFVCLFTYLFARAVSIRKWTLGGAFSLLLTSLIVYYLADEACDREFGNRYAVLMSPSAYIKSSPDDKGNDLFILHEGTKLEVLDQLGSWKKIRIANGSIGWLEAENIEEI